MPSSAHIFTAATERQPDVQGAHLEEVLPDHTNHVCDQAQPVYSHHLLLTDTLDPGTEAA